LTETVAAPPPPPPQEAPRKRSRKGIILMLLLGGPFLAAGGCALFLSQMNFNSGGSDNALGTLGGIVFLGGVLAFIVGALWGVARLIDRRFDKANQTK
jgi:hypothetical protein